MKRLMVVADSPICPVCDGAGAKQNLGQQPACEKCEGKGRLPKEVDVPIDLVTPFALAALPVLQAAGDAVQIGTIDRWMDDITSAVMAMRQRGVVVPDFRLTLGEEMQQYIEQTLREPAPAEQPRLPLQPVVIPPVPPVPVTLEPTPDVTIAPVPDPKPVVE